MSWFVCACVSAVAGGAEVAEQFRGDWIMVNGVLVLQVAENGTMTLRNSGAKGPIRVEGDGSFVWHLAEKPQSGRFAEGKLWLKNDQEGVPGWMEYLEFRRGASGVAGEVVEFARRQQAQAAGAFERVRRVSLEKAIRNNLRQLSAAADQYFLELGVEKLTLDQIVGPDKYIKTLSSVDGEDYSQLDFTIEARTWTVTSKSGITVTHER